MSKPFDPDELERQLAAKLTVTALQGAGSVPAARQVLEILDRIRSREAANEHRAKLEALADAPKDLASYLGYLGEDASAMERHLGHPMTDAERRAFEDGKRRRLLELRAVELDRAVRGQGKPAPWMRT